MKLLSIAFSCCLTSLAGMSLASAADGHPSATDTHSSRISEQAARSIAEDHFPNSAFESAELEKENDVLIWSIDLRPNGSNDVQEVHVDATTGKVIGTELETPQMQRSEAAADAKKN